MKKKKYTVKYRRTTLYLDKNPRKGICKCCNKKFKTQLHHWKYEFTTKEVKENPNLALKNTIELCYYDHRLANMIVNLEKNILRKTILLRLKEEKNG